MAKIELNERYAPGISTYGAKGNTGAKGADGHSMYYVSYDIADLTDVTDPVYRLVLANVKQAQVISSNTKLALGRPYHKGDLFVLANGRVYRLETDDFNSPAFDDGSVIFRNVGDIRLDNNMFDENVETGVVFNKGNAPVVLSDTETDGTEKEALLNIMSSEGKLVRMQFGDSAPVDVNGFEEGIVVDGNVLLTRAYTLDRTGAPITYNGKNYYPIQPSTANGNMLSESQIRAAVTVSSPGDEYVSVNIANSDLDGYSMDIAIKYNHGVNVGQKIIYNVSTQESSDYATGFTEAMHVKEVGIIVTNSENGKSKYVKF